MAGFKVVAVALSLWSSAAMATVVPNNNAAEAIFFSFRNSPDLQSWLQHSPLTAAHRAEINAYLKKNKLESIPLPHLAYRMHTSVLRFSNSYKVDLKKLPQTLIVNGVDINFAGNISFAAAVERLGRNPKTAQWWQDLLLPSAYAQNAIESAIFNNYIKYHKVYSVLSYYTFVDQYQACHGHEADHASLCHWPWTNDAKMIQADVFDNPITAFQCSKNKLDKFIYQNDPENPHSLEIKYDGNGNMTELDTLSYGQHCTYKIEGEKFVALGKDQDPEDCPGRTMDEYSSNEHVLKSGGTIKSATDLDVPIQRLQSCCASQECRDAMKEVVARSGGGTAAPAAPAPAPEVGR